MLTESPSQAAVHTGALDRPVAWLGHCTLRDSGESLPGSEVTKQTLTSHWLGGDPAFSTPAPRDRTARGPLKRLHQLVPGSRCRRRRALS